MYKIVGSDGRQYGPVSAEQLQQWIVEGRANAWTQTLGEGATEWKPLGALPEFAANFRPTTATAPPTIKPAVFPYRKTNAFAVWGLLCGIVAVFFCLCCCLSVPLGALGLILSLTGLSQINGNPDVYDGRAAAIVGIVLSVLGLLLGILIFWADVANGHFYHAHYWNLRRY
ncbi:MAG: DUF4190 domain-containing protein [Limisphaerales bacterium]